MSWWTLHDPAGVLEPEGHVTRDCALFRANSPIWRAVDWQLYAPTGELTTTRKTQP